jgi:hypothetical protein
MITNKITNQDIQRQYISTNIMPIMAITLNEIGWVEHVASVTQFGGSIN